MPMKRRQWFKKTFSWSRKNLFE